MPTDNIEFSIVVPCFNKAPLLAKGLATVFRQPFLRDKLRSEVIVVDNSSTRKHRDATRQVVESLRSDFTTERTQVRYVHSRKCEPTYASYTRNVGLRLSRGKVILTTDAEVLHVSQTVHQHYIRQSQADNLFVLTFCRDVPPDVSLEHDSLVAALYDQRYPIRISERAKPCWAPFCVSVHRKWMIAIGGWDEDFTAYGCEDHDLARRLEMMGVVVLHDDSIKVLHQMHDTNEEGAQAMFDLYKQKAREGNITANVGREWGKIEVPDDMREAASTDGGG